MSANRSFRGQPVLSWTLRRLWRSRHVASICLVCWEDQRDALQAIADEYRATILSRGTRTSIPRLDAISAARRWSDGWRGGLIGACAFDLGFDAAAAKQAVAQSPGEAALIVDPDSALVGPELLDTLVDHADEHPEIEYAFHPAAPGLSGLLLRPAMLDRLAASQLHLGRYLNYFPDLPGKDPIGKGECAPVPIPVARTVHRFTLDSARQVRRMEIAAEDLNGELSRIDAESQVHRLNRLDLIDPLPREVELELTTRRITSPIFSPTRYLPFDRPDLTVESARTLFEELSSEPDTRLTLSGVGDPLLHPQLFEILAAAREAGLRAIHLETDLLPASDEALHQLAASGVDVVSVHLPAISAATYAAVMGIDAYGRVMQNITTLLKQRVEMGKGTPLLVPTFTKCRENFDEMEPWYDHWLMAVGAATISGPSTCGGQIPDISVADMTPSRRVACRRLSSRLTIHSDGVVIPCGQDVTGRQRLGSIQADRLGGLWTGPLQRLREAHAQQDFGNHPVCAGCRDWHRP